MRQRGQAVEETGRRDGQADAGLLGQEACDRCRVAGALFMTEGQDPDACGLGHAAEVGDRNARHAVNGGETIELERVDDEIESVGLLALFACGVPFFYCCFSHAFLPKSCTRATPAPSPG